MTIIVAQKTTTGVLMGADETSTEGSRLFRRGTPKLVNITPRLAVGVAGKSRIGDMVIRSNAWPTLHSQSPAEFAVELTGFFGTVLKDEEKDAEFWALVAADHAIFYVATRCVLLVNSEYSALGNAEMVALGVLYMWNFDGQKKTAEIARNGLRHAMNACAEHVEAIRPPWIFAETIAP